MSYPEKFQKLDLLYHRLDILDRDYEMADVRGDLDKWRREDKETRDEIEAIYQTMSTKEKKTYYNL